MDMIALPFQGGCMFTLQHPGRRRKRFALGFYAPGFQPGKCTNSSVQTIMSTSRLPQSQALILGFSEVALK